MEEILIKNLFHTIFMLNRMGTDLMEPNEDGSATDDIYAEALDNFHDIADSIAYSIDWIKTDLDDDDIAWYDEYEDEIVSDFCFYLIHGNFDK